MMITQTIYQQKQVSGWIEAINGQPVSQLRLEYETSRQILDLQPVMIKRFLATQASQLATAMIERQSQIRFMLPDQINLNTSTSDDAAVYKIAEKKRLQMVGGIIERLERNDIRQLVRLRLIELENKPDPAIALAARLIRYTTAGFMVENMLPAGRTVVYDALAGDDIPSIPIRSNQTSVSALIATSDAITEEHPSHDRNSLQSPYVPAANRFFLPQWVAFDDQGDLLVNTLREAETVIESMQRYLDILHAAVALAPYWIVDPNYQQKRYGILGQLVNQGRQLAKYITNQIIEKIHARSLSQDLNRGLSLSVPYFDNQDLRMKMYDFDVIPTGKVMFIPAFVIRAARQEQAKVAQDTRLSTSTRIHLLTQLESIEKAF